MSKAPQPLFMLLDEELALNAVATMLVRHNRVPVNINCQLSAALLVKEINGYAWGTKPQFKVDEVVLQQGLHIYKKAIKNVEFIDMQSSNKNVPWVPSHGKLKHIMKGKEIKFLTLPKETDILVYDSEEKLLAAIMQKRDELLSSMNWPEKQCQYRSPSEVKLAIYEANETPDYRNKKRKLYKDLGPKTKLQRSKELIEWCENAYGSINVKEFCLFTAEKIKKIDLNIPGLAAGFVMYPPLDDGEEGEEKEFDENEAPFYEDMDGDNDELEVNHEDSLDVMLDQRLKEQLLRLKKKNVTFSLGEKIDVLNIFDTIKAIKLEQWLSGSIPQNIDINTISARETSRALQFKGGKYVSFTARAIHYLNKTRSRQAKKKGRNVSVEFEREVMGNLIICELNEKRDEVRELR
jgi:hypothetical protein